MAKKLKLNLSVFWLILCMIFTKTIYADIDSTLSLTHSQLDKLNKEITYDTVKSQLTIRQWVKDLFEKEASKKKDIDPNITAPTFEYFGRFVKSLAYILFVILIVAIIYFVMKDFKVSNLSKRKSKLSIDLDNIEDIASIDLNAMLKDALKSNDYRMAIRLRYLLILQSMAKNNIIRWAPEKTNRNYVNESSGSQLNNEFKSITRVFEHVWYGNEIIGETKYQGIEPLFIDLNSKVTAHG
jgi:Domain of unknown function (DUF4129)